MGGTKAENIALFHQFLDAGKPEQIAAYRDDNPILKEVLKVFNQTVQTQVIGYAVHKSILTSNDKECDRIALEKADAIMKKAFGDTCECLITFRLKVRSQVNPSIMDIRQVTYKKTYFSIYEEKIFIFVILYLIERFQMIFAQRSFCPLMNALKK